MIRKMKPFLLLFALACLLVACGSSEPQIIEVSRIVEREVEVEVVKEVEVLREVVVEVEREVMEEQASASDAMMDGATAETADSYVPQPTNVSQGEAQSAEPVAIVPENSREPAAMTFDDTQVSPFVDTRDDQFSTFAIDVDTGSYTLMRSYLGDYGQMPPEESVRVEEYINFFDYDYPAPADGAFGINLEAAPAPYGENDNYQLVRVGIQGYEVPAEERPDNLLIFVIDVSGSMRQENRIGLVKESLRLLTNALNATDRVGIVVYGSTARSVLDPTYVSDDRAILNAIDRLEIEGSTNAEAGIQQGYRMANRYALDGQETRLIVLSDGVANVGNTTAETILEHARRGISLSTFGFGMGNYNDALMEQLANQGDGTYAYVDSLREAQRWFVTDLNATLVTIAKDAKIQVEFNPAVVETYRLMGYENRAVADEDFRDDTVDAGEIGAGHSVTALYEVRLGEDVRSTDTALTVRVRYQDMESAEVVEIARSIRPSEFKSSYASASSSFQLAASVAEFAELLKDSYWARDNSLLNLWNDVEAIALNYPRSRDVQQLVDLVESAADYSQ